MNSRSIYKYDMRILEKIKESKKKAILIINKIDLVKKESLLKLIDLYQKEYNFEAVIPVSSIKSKYRDIILDEIEKVLNVSHAIFLIISSLPLTLSFAFYYFLFIFVTIIVT